MELEDFSTNGGRLHLKRKGMWEELRQIVGELDDIKDSHAKSVAEEYDWDIDKPVGEPFLHSGPAAHEFSWSFDAYKNQVAIEFEAGKQSCARWAWMKFQMGHKLKRDQMKLDEARDDDDFRQPPQVDVGVLLMSNRTRGASLSRCVHELESDVFSGILNISVPMYTVELAVTDD